MYTMVFLLSVIEEALIIVDLYLDSEECFLIF